MTVKQVTQWMPPKWLLDLLYKVVLMLFVGGWVAREFVDDRRYMRQADFETAVENILEDNQKQIDAALAPVREHIARTDIHLDYERTLEVIRIEIKGSLIPLRTDLDRLYEQQVRSNEKLDRLIEALNRTTP